jgi:hypothetical protein
MKSIEEIYKLCPKLKDIADRIENSQTETETENKARLAKRSDARLMHPEHWRISHIHVNGRWEEMVTKPRPGREEFEEAIMNIIDTRDPSGLKIQIFNGKRPTTNFDKVTCILAEEANIVSEEPNQNLGLIEIKQEIETLKKSKGEPADFQVRLLEIEHKHELQNLKNGHVRELDKKDAVIEALQQQVAELNEELDTQDAELGNAADKLLEKVGPKPIHLIAGAILEQALEDFVIHRPKILKDAFKLSDDQIKEIFVRKQEQLPVGTENPAENSDAEVKRKAPSDEYANYTPEHADALKNIHQFTKDLSWDDFKMVYNVFAFCCTKEGTINSDHVKALLGFLMPIVATEEEAAAK